MAERKLLIIDTIEDYDKKFQNYDIIYLSEGRVIENNCKILDIDTQNFEIEKKNLIKKIFNYTKIYSESLKNKKFQACLEINNFRNDRYKQYYKALKILFIKKKLNKYKNNVFVITDDNNFFNSYKSLTSTNKIKLINNNIFQKKISFLKTNLIFLAKILFIKILLLNKQESKIKSKEIYFSIYPLFFKNNINFIYNKKNINFLNTIISDESHLQECFIETMKRFYKIQNNKFFNHVESYISLKEIILFAFNIFKANVIFNRIEKKNFFVNGIDFSSSFKEIFLISYIKFFKNKIYLNAINFFIKKNNIKQFNFFLFEYSFGIQLNQYLLDNIPNLETVGYQHGLNSDNFIWETIPRKFKNSFPSKIIIKSEISKKIYKKKYNPKIILKQKYPDDFKEIESYTKILSKEKKHQNNYVVFLGLHDTNEMISALKKIKNTKIKFFLKLHPKVKIKKNNYPSNIKILKKMNNKKYFRYIVVSQSSSLVLLFLENKIPFKIIKNFKTINLLSNYKKFLKNNYLE